MKRLALALLVTVLAGIVVASPASAHAELEETMPTADAVSDDAPAAVELRFTEAVEPGLGGIRVIAPDGSRADDGDVEVTEGGLLLRAGVDADEPGTYTTAWSVTSEDGHLIAGSFLFSVERTSTPADVEPAGRPAVRFLGAVGRALAFGATMLLLGALAFSVLVLRRVDAGRTSTASLVSGAAVVVGALLALIAHVAIASERSLVSALGLLDEAVTDTRFGWLSLLRLLLGVAVVVLAVLWRRHPTWFQLAALAVPAVVLAAIPAIAGHAWTTSPTAIAVAVDALHVLAVGMWGGGLVLLLAHRDDPSAPTYASRFSNLALGFVTVAVLTGSISSYLQVRSLDGVDTPYGRLLVIKIVLVSVVVGIASLTRSIVRGRGEGWSVARAVTAELVVVVAIVGVTSLLVNQPPARNALVANVDLTVELQGGNVPSAFVQVIPARVGTNVIHLYFLDAQGIPTPVDVVEMTVGQADIPPRRVDITPVTADHVSAYGVELPTRGTWTITITAVRTGETSTGTVDVEVT